MYQFRMNNRKNGEVIEVRHSTACTSLCQEGLIALQRISRPSNASYLRGYSSVRNHAVYQHKTTPLGIRAMGKMYKLSRGGYRVDDNTWATILLHSIN